MKFSTALVRFGSVGELALELRKALTAIAAGWNVEHNPDGTHKASVTGVRLHAPTHTAGGSDPVTVTNLAGYPGSTSTFLRGDHTFATPTGTVPSAHHATHEQGGSDVVAFTTGVFERGRTTPMGEWTNVAFNAANFSSNTGSFVATTQHVNSYTLIGKTLCWSVMVQGTVTGAPNVIFFQFPSGLTSARAHWGTTFCGSFGNGQSEVPSGSTQVVLYVNQGATAFPAGNLYIGFTTAISIL